MAITETLKAEMRSNGVPEEIIRAADIALPLDYGRYEEVPPEGSIAWHWLMLDASTSNLLFDLRKTLGTNTDLDGEIARLLANHDN